METKNYQIFNFFNSNRELNEASVKKIMNSIEKIGYIPAKKILVNRANFIIDGQHRFEACRRLNIPIYYSYLDTDENTAMIELNTSQTSWKLFDYVHSYASQGIDCYKKLIEFNSKYKLGETNSLEILFKSQGCGKYVRKGVIFTINPHADSVVSFINSSKEFLHFYKSTKYVQAVNYMFGRISLDSISRILKDISIVRQQSTVSAYLAIFENIHNRNLRIESKRISLRTE